jgi:hypothetical protein
MSTKIPDMWLVGCTQMLRRQGFGHLDALKEAVAIWNEQGRLQEQYDAERAVTA